MRFEAMNVAWWLLLIPILVGFLVYVTKKKQFLLKLFLGGHARIIAIFDPVRVHIKNILLVFAAVFAILALMRPQWGFEWVEGKSRG